MPTVILSTGTLSYLRSLLRALRSDVAAGKTALLPVDIPAALARIDSVLAELACPMPDDPPAARQRKRGKAG